MVGMPKEQVLACMGAPINKAAEGMTRGLGLHSGNGMNVAMRATAASAAPRRVRAAFLLHQTVSDDKAVAVVPTVHRRTFDPGEQCAYGSTMRSPPIAEGRGRPSEK